MRVVWIMLGLLYGLAAVYLAATSIPYPRWTWTTFFLIAGGILLYFSSGFWISSAVVLTALELLIWVVAVVSGVALFGTLVDIGERSTGDHVNLPTGWGLVAGIGRMLHELFSR